MTSEEAYIHFTDLVEKNSTNNNLNVDKSRFVDWFNFASKLYQIDILDNRLDSKVREMSPFLRDVELESINSEEMYDTFAKPDDYFDIANVFITAKKGTCTASDFTLNEEKTENVHISLYDVNLKPSYKSRESFYHLSEDGVSIYHGGDFDIKGAKMTYYIQIPKIDIAGYIHPDGTQSTDINPQTEDRTTIKILQMMAVLFVTAEGNLNQYQANLANLKQL